MGYARTAVAILLSAAVLSIYDVDEGAGVGAIWNRKEAYFFVHVDRTGHLLYPWILFKEYVIGGFGAASEPDKAQAFLVVIHVTLSGVERRGPRDSAYGQPGDPW